MSAEKSQTQQFALRPDVVVSVLQDGAVLLDLETKYFYSVNATGWIILQLLENGATIEEVKAQCSTWGAQTEDFTAVSRFLEKLMSEKLVTGANNQAAKKEVRLNGSWMPPLIEKHKEPLQRIMTNAFDPSLPLAE